MNKTLETYECEGQLSLFDIIADDAPIPPAEAPKIEEAEPGCFADYVGKCKYCMWGTDEKTCHWSVNCENKRDSYRECDENHSFWRPEAYKIPRLCGNCKYHNDFHYNLKDKYKAEYKAKGFSRDGMFDPLEDNELYCTRHEGEDDAGAVNRTHPFADRESRGFGVGYWHRQYEWTTCEAWELDTIYHKELGEKR